MADTNKDKGVAPAKPAATSKTADAGPIPKKWLDSMLAQSKDLPKGLEAIQKQLSTGDTRVVNQLVLQTAVLNDIAKAVGPDLRNTLLDTFKSFKKDTQDKEEEKTYKDRKKQKDKEKADDETKLVKDLGNVVSKATKQSTGDESEAANKAALEAKIANAESGKVEVTPTTIVGIKKEVAEELGKSIALALKGIKTDTGGVAGFFTTIVNAVKSLGPALASLGKGLGNGFAGLGKGIGAGIAGVGKGIGGFLAGIGEGFKILGPGLKAFANPQAAIGLGLVVLAINGLALALRLAAPAIAAAMPFFVKLAEVLGTVLMHAIDKIPDMIKAVGVAIGTVLTMAGPVIIQLTKVIGTYLINVIKNIGTTIENLVKIAGPFIVQIVKIVKEAVVQLAPYVVQIVKTVKDAFVQLAPFAVQIIKLFKETVAIVMPYILELGRAIKDILVTALDLLKPVLLALVPILDKVVTFLGTNLTEAIKYVGPVLKDLSESIKIAVAGLSDILTGVITLATHLVDDIKDIFVKGVDGITDLVHTIGDTVQGSIKAIGDSIVNVINTVTDSIVRLSTVSGDKLKETAGGIAAVAGAMALFAGGAVASGFGNLIGGLASKIGGQKPPLEQLIAIGEQADNFTKVADGLKQVKESMISFSGLKVDLDPIKKFADVIGVLKDKLSNTVGSVFSGITSKVTGTNPLDLIVSIADHADSIDDVADSIKSLIDNFNKADVAKITAVMAALAMTPTQAAVLTQTAAAPSTPATQTAASVSGASESATTTTSQTTKVNTVNEQVTNLNKLSTQAATPSVEVPQMREVNENLQLVAAKLDSLIKLTQVQIEIETKDTRKGEASIASTTTSTNQVISNSNPNITINGDSGNRDIPYLERNKYRQTLMYTRGLL